MKSSQTLGTALKELPPYDPIILDNVTCVYCGTVLTPENDSEEHVIARRFVPVGKLDRQWNLIVRACKPCNRLKADLEDDISAITMQPDTRGIPVVDDPALTKDAFRKGTGSRSRMTGKSVEESYQPINIQGEIAPGVEFTLDGMALPEIDDKRIYDLALRQVRAFFYWITYDETIRAGRFWRGGAYPIMHAPRSDWGNVAHRAFMTAVQGWDLKVCAVGAAEFFKVMIRRHLTAASWAWAVEWNQNYRVVGFVGEEQTARDVVATFPPLDWGEVPVKRGRIFVRSEVGLAEDEDRLFAVGADGA